STNPGDVALGAGSTTAPVVNTPGATIGGTPYTFAGTNATSTVSVGAPGAERTITNVAAGRLSGTSTDAVNGSQLFASNQAIDQNATDISNALNSINSITSTGSQYFHTNSTGAAPTATGLDSVAIGSGAVSTNPGDVALGAGSTTAAVVNTPNATIAGNLYTFAGTNATSTVSVGSPGAERTLTNVAAGRISATSTDAVNGSQLNATNQAVGSLQTQVTTISNTASTLGNSAVKYDTTASGSPDYSSATLNGVTYSAATHTGGTVLHNVAYGLAGGDAVNVDQLNEAIGSVENMAQAASSPLVAANGDRTTEAAVATGAHAAALGATASATGTQAAAFGYNASATGTQAAAIGSGAKATGADSTAIGTGSQAKGANSVALGSNSVADRDNTVSVGAPGSERQIANVAPGSQGTDAVNVNQLNQSVAEGVNQANAYTNQQFNALGNQVNSVARYAYSGVAAATALTMIPDVDPGKTIAVGVGTATYKGYQAAALGASARIMENVKVKIGAGVSAAGTAFGAGASYQW
ncbi:YadA-like family protein, partial [Caballeronia sp. LZ065]|uniref:YadA family autotransporter adhesin n=1 Tax=Caballeronia sp. LZ065 TaxID=3038571 RepID=UPI00285A9B6F